MIQEAIKRIVENGSLSFTEAKKVFLEIFDQEAVSSQIAAFLTGLHMAGESENVIAAAATVIRDKAIKIKVTLLIFYFSPLISSALLLFVI